MNKDNVTKEMKYELWWKYLLESDKYRILCSWFCEKEKNPSLTWPEDVSRDLGETFGFFGDIFNNSFDEWWQRKKDPISPIGVIEYTKQQASHEFDATVRQFCEIEGREPSLTEFKRLFIDRVFDYLPGSFNFRVCFHPTMTTKNMADQFSKLIRAKRKLPELQDYETDLRRGWLLTSGRFRYDELKRYLKVYCLHKKGMTMNSIIEILDPNNTHSSVTDFHGYLRHAKTIFENLESGLFPGKYYEKKKLKNIPKQ